MVTAPIPPVRPHPRRPGRVAAAAALVTATMVGALLIPTAAQAAGADPVTVTVRGTDVAAAAKNVNGLTFKGFGVLSANSTSALLLDYKSQHPEKYWELIETLFGGDFPIMNTVKIEMGNDRNTSTGPNASTMRSRDEYPNVLREPGFQLAADAKTVAHGPVHVSILRWNRPTWVKNNQDQYVWFKNTTLAAYRQFGYMIDSINPDANETSNPDLQLYKDFSGWLRTDTTGYEGATAGDPNNGFASATERDLYTSIRTIAGDTVGTPPVALGDGMTGSDSSLRDAVDIVGFHYSSADDRNGNMKKIAEQLDREVWNSEGQSTFSNSADRPNNTNSNEQGGVGTSMGGPGSALEMGNWVTTGFSASRRTLNIFQPAIGSFYDGFQYSSKELVNAREPWSGWISYDGGLAVLEQFTQFAKLGWENSDNTAGIWRAIPQASGSELGTGNPPSGARAGGASYTTLAAPDGADFSTVIVNDSSFSKTYRVAVDGMPLGDDKTLEVWETRAADAGQAADANYVRPLAEMAPAADGSYTVTVKAWSTVTATTLDHAETRAGVVSPREGFGRTAPATTEYTASDGGRNVLDTDSTGNVNGVTDDAYLYADDFDYRGTGDIQGYDPDTRTLVDSGEGYLSSRGAADKPSGTPSVQAEDQSATPRYSNDTNGAFESVATSDAAHGRVLRQQIGSGMAGGAWNGGDPKTTIGDARWANYVVGADVMFEADGAQYATIGAREQGGTANGQAVSAAELRVEPTGAWSFQRYGTVLSTGNASATAGVDFRTGAGEWNRIAVEVAGDVYTAQINGVDVASYTDAAPQATGRIQLGSSFTFVRFDNLTVETVPGYTPYYTQIIDGMHQTSWSDTSASVLRFDDEWSHVNGQGMFEWQRTASKSTRQGATMAYTFEGTGLDIIGTNSGAPTLDVIVDGEQLVAAAPTLAAGSERTAYMLRGLRNGTHTVEVRTANADALNVDAVGVVTANADASKVDTTALAARVDTASALDEDEYSVDSWARLQSTRDAARDAVADPGEYGLDAEGARALEARLSIAVDQLTPRDVSDDVKDVGTLSMTLPGRTLPATVSLEGADAAVTWTAGSATAAGSAAELSSFTATGRTTEKTAAGVYQRITATVLTLPADLTYFIDSGSSGAAAGSAFATAKAAFPDLRNDSADQKWDGSSTAATWGYATSATTVAAGSPTDWGSSYVGADFTKPIVYSLTLPAGSYNIVAVQAPRAGLTTNVYSKVRAPGAAETTQSAVSNGAATPVAQRVNVSADGVVRLEFGTTGTSGYNARLALVYVQALPRDLGVVGTLEADDELPATVAVDGVDKAVTWDADSAAQKRTALRKLVLTGRFTEGGQKVVAAYEVIPAGLVYYIDSGTGTTPSPQFTAVQKAVPTLRNDKVDQVSTSADQWGYVADGMKVKGSTDITDKFSTGLYQDTTRLTYRLPLPAGQYTLTGGFTEWWGLNRTMNHTVSVGGTELAKGNVPLTGVSGPLTGDLTFTLSEAATVDYVITNEGAGSEKPVISWLAVKDTTRATAPQNVSATAASDTSITVAWEAPAQTGAELSGYRVYEAGGTEPVCEVAEATCTLSDLAPGSAHAFEVAAVNAVGEGDRSAATPTITLPEVPSNDGATAAPGTGVLSSNDGWDTGLKDGTFQLTMNLWWGSNGSLFKLYRDGELVATMPLTMSTPNAQKSVVEIAGLSNGTYKFTGELVNSKGTTATKPLTVTVTDAAPGRPVLSSDNSDRDGAYSVTANLWWGTNATSYRLLENDVEIASGALAAATPAAQKVVVPVTGRAIGTYTYTIEFVNAGGVTTSTPLKVVVAK